MNKIKTAIEEMISIVEIEGEDALTDDRVEECCKKHEINLKEFNDLVTNSITATAELPSGSLNKVVGGSRSGLRKAAAIAALLNVQNVIGVSAANDQLNTKATANHSKYVHKNNSENDAKSSGIASKIKSFVAGGVGGALTVGMFLAKLIESKQNEINDLKKRLSESESKSNGISEEIKRLESTESSEDQAALEELRAQLQEQIEKIDDLTSQIEEKKREIEQIQGEKENAKKEAQDSRQAADAKQAEIDRLGRVNQELNQQLAGIQSANQQELTAKQQKINKLESEKQQLNQQLAEAKADLEKANAANQQAVKAEQAKIAELESEKQRLEGKIVELESTKSQTNNAGPLFTPPAQPATNRDNSIFNVPPPASFSNQTLEAQPQQQRAANQQARADLTTSNAKPPLYLPPSPFIKQTPNAQQQQQQQQQTQQLPQLPQQAATRSVTSPSAPQPAPSATAQPNLKQQIGLSSVTANKPTQPQQTATQQPSQQPQRAATPKQPQLQAQQMQQQQTQRAATPQPQQPNNASSPLARYSQTFNSTSQPPQPQPQQQPPQPQQPPKPANPATQATDLAVTKINSVFTPIEAGTQKLYPVKLNGANLPDDITLVGSPNVGNKNEWYQKAYNCLLVEDIFRSYYSDPPPRELILTPAQEMVERTNVCALNQKTKQYHMYSVLWPKATLQYKDKDTSEVLSMDKLTVKSRQLPSNSTSAPTDSSAPTSNIYISSTNTLDSLFKVLSNKYKTEEYDNEYKKACVANFANPTMAGGYSRYGVQSQEQGLCVTTNLLPRLCSEDVKKEYYDYNALLLKQARLKGELNEHSQISKFDMDCNLRSDCSVYNRCIFTPGVSQLKDANQPCLGVFLDSPKTLNVITISAPSVDKVRKESLEALMQTHNYASDKEYKFCLQLYMQQWRIWLCTAYSKGMKHIVLGALGCGKFNGNPCIAAIALFTLLQNEGPTNDKDGNPITTDKFWKDCFDTIIIAISTQNPTEDPNYKAFKFYLDHFFKNKYNIC